MEQNLSYALCPNCKKESTNKRDVDTFFGFRKFRGRMYVQSHCKDCRGQEQKQRQRLGIEEHRT